MFLSPTQAAEVRERFGTPCYVYDQATLERTAREALAFPNAFGLTVRYAMKANPNAAILKIFLDLGLHIDASSDYEVERAIRRGAPSKRIQLTSQMPSRNLKAIVDSGVLLSACSLHQLDAFGRAFPGDEVCVRMNPGLGSGSTNRTNTGGPGSSFGIWHEHFDEVGAIAARHGLRVRRLHSHIGSGSDPAVWQRVAHMTLAIAAKLPEVRTVNLGGGFKVARVVGEATTDLQECGAPIVEEFRRFREDHGRALHLEIEPGTYLVANAGAIVATCVDVVDTGPGGFVFAKLDTGMTEVTRPSLYG